MVLFTNPETVQLRPPVVQEPTTSAEDDAAVLTRAVYDVIGELPSDSGAVHVTVTLPSPRDVVTDLGAPGREPGVRAMRSEDVPGPTLFVANTET